MEAIAFRSGASMNGPFLTERAMLFRLPLHDELIRALVVASLVAQRRFAPRRHRVISLHTTFAASMRMIDRIHHNTANRRPDTHVTHAAGFAERDVFVIQISYLADRRHAIHVDESNLTGRQLHVRIATFFGDKLRRRTRAARHLRALAGTQLDVM